MQQRETAGSSSHDTVSETAAEAPWRLTEDTAAEAVASGGRNCRRTRVEAVTEAPMTDGLKQLMTREAAAETADALGAARRSKTRLWPTGQP
jgi:hypothetical protein